MINKFFLLLIVIFSLFLSGCGGRTTVVVIEETPPPSQTYIINVTETSVVEPRGTIYMEVFNAYETIIAYDLSESIIITDKRDNLPITFQLKDSLGVILEETYILTDPEFIDSTQIIVYDDLIVDNYFSFSFTLQPE